MKEINIYNIYKKVIELFKVKRRFIIYRKPNDHIVYLCIDDDNTKKIDSDFYILIKDFHDKNMIIINPKEIYISKINNNIKRIFNNKINFNLNDFKEEKLIEYNNIIKKSLILIKNNILDKIVLSRKKEILFNNFNLKKTIQNMIHTYFESFINIWYDPIYGLWLGATPELLFNIQNNILTSVALAGTMKINNNPRHYPLTWNFKELEEHYIVVNYICNILKKYPGKIFLDQTKTLNTGLIKHLKTYIKFIFKNNPKYKEILSLLHPTPAICGIPKDIAYNFIINNEGYNRSFYTGYIGIINKNLIEFYVNLRCANILNKVIIIYAGCGITNYSNPNNELFESEIKMHNILYNIDYN